MQPDVLVVEEMKSQDGIDQFLAQALDSTYSAGTFIDGPDTDNGIYLKDSLFTFISNTPISTALRNISEFKIYNNITLDTLIIFAVHLKASQGTDNEQKRLAEVNILRNVTDNLHVGTDYIVVGDFNIYYSSEPAFQRLLDTTSTGFFLDPINAVGNWHNNQSFSSIHTQCTRVDPFGGGSSGGLDDRFDMILVSPSIMQEGKIDYIDSTMVPYGNDGQHFNGNINDPPYNIITQEVANALYYASDHLPVMADFTFSPLVSVNNEKTIVYNYKLYQNYPNPFNPSTIIKFEVPEAQNVTLEVYNVLGQKIRTLFNGLAKAGINSVEFNSTGTNNLTSGIYIYTLRTKNSLISKKFILLK